MSLRYAPVAVFVSDWAYVETLRSILRSVVNSDEISVAYWTRYSSVAWWYQSETYEMGLSKWLSNHDEYDIMENPFYFCFLLSCYTLQTLISHHWTLRIGKLWPVTTTFQNQRIANNKEAWKQSSNTTRTFNFGGRDILNSPMILISVSFIKSMNEWMQINRKNLQFWWSGQSEFLCDFDKNILLKEWMKEWTNWFVREKINGQMILNRSKFNEFFSSFSGLHFCN